MTFKQVFLINTDLKMSVGKIAVQVAHGEVIYMYAWYDERCRFGFSHLKDRYDFWRAATSEDPIGMMKKVVLKATESEIRNIYTNLKFLDIWCYLIYDKGITKILENSLTCIVVEPLEEKQCNILFGDLKLL
jgi:PTH2 family peptidyl-tRNA hydrolase